MTWYLAVLTNYAGFRGRTRRREYWTFVPVNAIIGIVWSRSASWPRCQPPKQALNHPEYCGAARLTCG